MRRIISFFMFVTCVISVSAQTKATLTGFVKDSESGEALSYATIQLMSADTTKYVLGSVTNTLGGYSIKNVNAGKYVVKITYLGYHNFYKTVEIKEEQTLLNIGTVMMVPNSVVLQEAVVTATVQQMTVKEDTVIVNADAFKTPEGSVLEELIKKIPGAEVGSDGSITINGKKISKILVKGKEFFNNDTEMAMKNLPTNIVEKIKIYDKQSDQARITGIDDGEEETVMDLTIKKGMDKGWFGNVDIAGGTHSMYSARAMINRFDDNNQMSLVGNIGNTQGGGTRTTQMGGLNLVIKPSDKIEVGGNVRYTHAKNDSWSRRSSENYVSTQTNSFTNSFSKSISHNGNWNGNFKIEWKLDSLTTILFRPNFSFGNNDSQNTGNSATFNDNPYEYSLDPLNELNSIPDSIKTNHNITGSMGDSDSKSLNGNLMLNRRLNSSGRNASVRVNGSWGESDADNFNVNKVEYFNGRTGDFIYRYRVSPTNNNGFGAGLTYTEPLVANKVFLQMNYGYNYSRRKSDSRTYNIGDITRIRENYNNIQDSLLKNLGYLPEDYLTSIADSLSRYSDDQNYNHNIELSLRVNSGSLNMQAGLQFQPQHQKIEYRYLGHDTIASRDYARLSPTLNLRYRFTKQHQLRVRYKGTLTQPSITSLFDWDDDTDPLRTNHGNPDLKPSFTHNMNVDYNNYISTRLQSFNARLSWSCTTNSISNKTEYDSSTGKQETTPENICGNWSINGNFGFNTPLLANDRLVLNTNTSVSFTNNVAYIYQNRETLKNNVGDIRVKENLSVTRRWDYMDIRLNGTLSYNNAKSELIATANRSTWDFSYGLSTTGNFENGMGYSTDISMSSRRGYSAEAMNTNELIWNAQVSYRFLQGKKATISLQAFDILQQRSNVSRTITALSRSDSENNSVYSYMMLHFTYRFNMFGGKESQTNMRRTGDDVERTNRDINERRESRDERREMRGESQEMRNERL